MLYIVGGTHATHAGTTHAYMKTGLVRSLEEQKNNVTICICNYKQLQEKHAVLKLIQEARTTRDRTTTRDFVSSFCLDSDRMVHEMQLNNRIKPNRFLYIFAL